nr:lysophospholipid acyltransferase family protein [Ectothiorhodosinus mongolicus]
MLTIRASVFWLGMVLSTVIVGLVIPLLAPLPWRLRYRLLAMWPRFNLFWLRLCCGIRYRVNGIEHLPNQAAIVMAKHQSTWETLALTQILPPQVWVLKQELLNVPVFGWGMRLLSAIALDRAAGRKAMVELVRQGGERLQRGLWVIVFPEGTRTSPGAPPRYRMGGAVLAARTGVPIVPIAHNAGLFWPRGSFIKYPGTIEVEIGPLIPTEGRQAGDIMRDVQQWIEPHTNRLCGLLMPTGTASHPSQRHQA